jgi:hypothetical protein
MSTTPDNNIEASLKNEKKHIKINIKWILITVGLCAACILLTYLIKPTYTRNSSMLAAKVDKSLNQSKLLLEAEINHKYRFIGSFSSYKKTKVVVQQAAEEIVKETEKLIAKINTLRIMVAEESGGIYALEESKSKWDEMGYRKIKITKDPKLDGSAVGFKNRAVSNKIFIINGEAKKLKAEIIKTRANLFETLDKLLKVSNATEGVFFRENDIDYVKNNLFLEDPEKKYKPDWLNAHFRSNTVAETLLLLRKLEFDANASLFQMMSLLHDNIAY